MEELICMECFAIDEYEMRKIIRKYEGEGYSFEMEVEVPFCLKCGKELISESIEESIQEKANKIIRERRNIITKEEILEILDKYHTSQKFMSKLLNWGEITLTRYIQGNYTPNQENSNKLKSLKNPYIFQELLNLKYLENKENRLIEKSFVKAQNSVNNELQKIEKEGGKIFSVIHWFLAQSIEEVPITYSVLEKLLYFVQSWSTALNAKWMFEEENQARIHEDIYSKVQEMFQCFGHRPLPKVKSDIGLNDEDIKILELVKMYYYDVYNAKTLEKVFNFEKVCKHIEIENLDERIINEEIIRKYYEEIVEKYNISLENTSGIKEYLNQVLK